jgi:hypothetical protein
MKEVEKLLEPVPLTHNVHKLLFWLLFYTILAMISPNCKNDSKTINIYSPFRKIKHWNITFSFSKERMGWDGMGRRVFGHFVCVLGPAGL